MIALPLVLTALSFAAPAPVAKAAPKPPTAVPARGDTTTRPTATIVLPGLKVEQVKAKITPRLMNRGWMMTQNRNDSVDFNHLADSTLVGSLFPTATWQPRQRVILRFGIRNSPDGAQTRLQAILLTPKDSTGALTRSPLPADSSVLHQSLEAIQVEEFGPGMLIPTLEGPKKDKKKAK